MVCTPAVCRCAGFAIYYRVNYPAPRPFCVAIVIVKVRPLWQLELERLNVAKPAHPRMFILLPFVRKRANLRLKVLPPESQSEAGLVVAAADELDPSASNRQRDDPSPDIDIAPNVQLQYQRDAGNADHPANLSLAEKQARRQEYLEREREQWEQQQERLLKERHQAVLQLPPAVGSNEFDASNAVAGRAVEDACKQHHKLQDDCAHGRVLPLLVTGVGRSGTHHTENALRKMGVKVCHEAACKVGDWQWGRGKTGACADGCMQDGSISWIYAVVDPDQFYPWENGNYRIQDQKFAKVKGWFHRHSMLGYVELLRVAVGVVHSVTACHRLSGVSSSAAPAARHRVAHHLREDELGLHSTCSHAERVTCLPASSGEGDLPACKQ